VVERVYQALPAATLKKIEGLVKQAVGFDAARGDEITVENIRFTEPSTDLSEVFAESNTQQMMMLAGDWVLPLIFLLLFFMVIVRPLMRFLFNPTEAEADLSRLLPAGIEELEAELEAERDKLRAMPDTPAQLTVDIEELEELLSENSRLVKDNPQQAALLIRYWLNEGRM
jgi:flagellar M-ring protein FliF